MTSYGFAETRHNNSMIDELLESLKICGYYLYRNFIDIASTKNLITELDRVTIIQNAEIDEKILVATQEVDLIRAPFAYSKDFLSILFSSKMDEVSRAILGEYYILNLQNAIINQSNRKHHQSNWHRDLPYQNWINSKSLCSNILICLSPFTEDNGSTEFIPGSHLIDFMPSERYIANNKFAVTANAGDAIVFDAMLIHRAGHNRSTQRRIALNNSFSVPILRQQIDVPSLLAENFDLTPRERKILGFEVVTPKSVSDLRMNRYLRKDTK